jgi:hypothetical protein
MTAISNIYYKQPIETGDDNAMITLKSLQIIHIEDDDCNSNIPGFVYKKWLAMYRLKEQLNGGNNV